MACRVQTIVYGADDIFRHLGTYFDYCQKGNVCGYLSLFRVLVFIVKNLLCPTLDLLHKTTCTIFPTSICQSEHRASEATVKKIYRLENTQGYGIIMLLPSPICCCCCPIQEKEIDHHKKAKTRAFNHKTFFASYSAETKTYWTGLLPNQGVAAAKQPWFFLIG